MIENKEWFCEKGCAQYDKYDDPLLKPRLVL